ncbi:uncharacterized protein LOC116842281 isoform X1 [Odontomachus brunneus]|uniref:uncharacterized protein LOC116842281 isoform X1 n=2 Tax=Odontomachus brunneus TaxID=486640 RepID=UPI0013F1B75B|nr:uncharacterized protein LOC116842281 isoform X1 [Odontomachus brunneus]XP_032667134.1 uncharacterized protein LOC116842281 isoform X1 [Odontomachus brunneus]XP_032667135.1 uncharacterized protein LOC116842281 isoform X1 [Odontomachus brunneus]
MNGDFGNDHPSHTTYHATLSSSCGYVYMNGDIGKLPPGAVYPATPEPLGPVAGAIGGGVSSLEYGVMNGAPSGSELILDAGVGSLEATSQHAISIGGAVGYGPVDVAALGDASASAASMADLSVPGIPLEQLKQMLSSQLEYYFSRYRKPLSVSLNLLRDSIFL